MYKIFILVKDLALKAQLLQLVLIVFVQFNFHFTQFMLFITWSVFLFNLGFQ